MIRLNSLKMTGHHLFNLTEEDERTKRVIQVLRADAIFLSLDAEVSEKTGVCKVKVLYTPDTSEVVTMATNIRSCFGSLIEKQSSLNQPIAEREASIDDEIWKQQFHQWLPPVSDVSRADGICCRDRILPGD